MLYSCTIMATVGVNRPYQQSMGLAFRLRLQLCEGMIHKIGAPELTDTQGRKSRGGQDTSPQKCRTGNGNTSCPPKYGAYMLQFQLASNYINILFLSSTVSDVST